MDCLHQELVLMPEVQEICNLVDQGGCPVVLTGTSPVHRALLSSAIASRCQRPLLFLCTDESEAKRLQADFATLTGTQPLFIGSREWQFRKHSASSRQWERQRISALYQMADHHPSVVIGTVEGMIQRTLPPHILKEMSFSLSLGTSCDPNELQERLIRNGYSLCEQVEGVGQFAHRGGIFDIFSPGYDFPVRLELFDTEVDSMGFFDPETQRRIQNTEAFTILPAAEALPSRCEGGEEALSLKLQSLQKKYAKKEGCESLCRMLGEDSALCSQHALPSPDRYFPLIYSQKACALDYLSADTIVVWSDSPRIRERLKDYLWQQKEDFLQLAKEGLLCGECADLSLSTDEFVSRMKEYPLCIMDSLPVSQYLLKPRELLSLQVKQLATYGGSLDAAANDLLGYQVQKYRVLVLCSSESRASNLHHILEERNMPSSLEFQLAGMPHPGEIRVTVGSLSAGAEFPSLSLAILSEGQFSAISPKMKKAKEKKNQQKLQSFTDLSPGDLVVHTHHGIGRFVGIEKIPVDGVIKDYIKIAYAGSDCLYVPATQLNQVSKFIGGGEDGEHVRLHKLGGTEWARSKSRTKSALKEMADELIQLYAQRQRQRGYAFSSDSPWQKEFEEAFPYEETEDQLSCTEEIKRDMERPIPMDRLLCGDVGYGKTEVALRAIMKCIMDGKQAAILVPTTILAQQHYSTALNRFRSFPVNIAVLSRFQTAKQAQEILKKVRRGEIDLLIGTHKILQKGIEFKNLGLLVVDEEQRFGVSHKEKLKELARQVDVLTLTATPIPRTLNMALSGIRDLSMLEQPPANRLPVQTYVLEHDWGILVDAMQKEIARGGQVFYLHNRVETIDRTAARIQQMLGEDVRVIVGHGKMSEDDLSSVMQQMIDGEAQVLVCTTIIETGIDIPNVNTLIIENADQMGLAQLHQLRGRIGRSTRRAFAYMTFRTGKVLTEVAEKRLTAIREYVEFGSGFKIAMRDLEIRGAGNLLGPEQSGYMMSVGYDMYLRLLEEAILEEKGDPIPVKTECAADLTVSANIPDYYVSSPEQRMDLYRRIALLEDTDDLEDLMDELIDRYGEPPKSVLALLDVALLRATASKAGVADISQKANELFFTLATFSVDALMNLCVLPKYKQRILLNAGETPRITLRLRKNEDVISAALELVEDLLLKLAPAQTP